MPPSLPVILIGLALAAIIALAYYIEARHPDPRQPTDALTHCAWCIHRDACPEQVLRRTCRRPCTHPYFLIPWILFIALPTLVEVKRSADTRIRRKVVGQMLDYDANAVVCWPL